MIFRLISNIFKLANLEAKLAMQTLPWVIGLLMLMVIILACSWITILTIFFYLLIKLNLPLLAALFFILILNLLILLILYFTLTRLKKNLFFYGTHRQLKRLTY